jgi:hypothetical protein
MELFTPEDKKTLRITSRYLQSLGISSGLVEFNFYDGSDDVDLDKEIPFGKHEKNFSNHHNIEVPEPIYPLIDKILMYCNDKMTFRNVYVDYLNYVTLSIDIDVDMKMVSATKYCGYYDSGSEDGTTWDSQEDEEVKKLLEMLSEESEDSSLLVLRYNGGGDSGYIEGNFENQLEVPASVEDWCYQQLENNHGGWEINEGSSGYFEFDLKNGLIYLYHTMNEEFNVSDTIFEESFAK